MSKNNYTSSRERRESSRNSKSNIFHTEETDLNISRKRSERQASQGVKLLVNREKGISQEGGQQPSSISGGRGESSREAKEVREVREVKRVPPSNFNLMNNPVNSQNYTNPFNPMTSSLHPIHSQSSFHPISNPSQQVSITPIQSHLVPASRSHPNSRRDDKILNKFNFEKILQEKLRKEGLDAKNIPEITNFMNTGLESYMKNVIEKLITISRTRNVNLNLYSKQSEKNPIFKIHTFNLEKQVSNNNPEIGYNPYKEFSILFTKNMKNTMGMLEQYEELNLKKMRQEKVSLYKSKLEEITKEKEKANETNKIKESVKVKPRVRKRDTMLKSVRNTLAKSQKRDEMAKHKKETQITLETFLDGRPRFTTATANTLSHSQSHQRFDPEMASNVGESHNLETYTKFSEISKSEQIGTAMQVDGSSNDINLTIFKYYTPSQNPKLNLNTNVRRRITLKDLIHFLEGERKTPLQNLILHKALVKLNQSSH